MNRRLRNAIPLTICMIGLVGIVFGMIQSFMVLAVPGSTPKPEDLAKGISHAVVVTLLGIGLSVPAIFFHAFGGMGKRK